jgi:hypothetical protein
MKPMQNIKHRDELCRDEGVRSQGISELGKKEEDRSRAGETDITHFQAASSFGGYHCQPTVRRLCSFLAFIAGLATLGCATTHATLQVTAPTSAMVGTPFTITVTAVYEGNRDTVINSIVQFTSSDSAAILPGYYKFTAADEGFHTWTNGVILKTPGNQTITATMVNEAGITGTVTVTVDPASADAKF